jgi:phosphoribosylanthranilate isomerase
MAPVKVKICGITNVEDALAAVHGGADLVGINFYPKSLRCVTLPTALKIRVAVPTFAKAVGVFVNAAASEIASNVQAVKLDAVQLHGDESPEFAQAIARFIPVIKAFRVEPEFPLSHLDKYPNVLAFLFDAAHAGQYGGTGRTSDWEVARRAATSHRIILAGGLKVDTVAAAIRIVRPYAVDVASGVESKPGKKDHGLIREFIQEVRRAEREEGIES